MARKRRAVECVSYLDDDPYEEPDERSLMIDLNVDSSSNKDINKLANKHIETSANENKEVNKQTNHQSEEITQLQLQLLEERREHRRALLDIRAMIDQHIANVDVALGSDDDTLEVEKVKNVEQNQEKNRTKSIQKKVETEKVSERKRGREEELFDSVRTTTRESFSLKDANNFPQLSVSVANVLTDNSIEDLDSSDAIDTIHTTSSPILPVSTQIYIDISCNVKQLQIVNHNKYQYKSNIVRHTYLNMFKHKFSR